MSINTVNAIIIGAELSDADGRGVLTAMLTLDYGGSAQGFGGLRLYRSMDDKQNYAGHFIWRVMEIAGVSRWSELVRKPVRARQDGSAVYAIGHILKDEWFNPTEDFKV